MRTTDTVPIPTLVLIHSKVTCNGYSTSRDTGTGTGTGTIVRVLESWLIIPLFPVGILLGWGGGQMLICCVNLFIYFRLYKVPDGKL